MLESKPLVDRKFELKLASGAMHPQIEDSIRVLVFYGHGGRGKTAIREIIEAKKLREDRLPYLLIDFENPMLRNCQTTFSEMRNQLRPRGVAFPAFDRVWGRYQQARDHRTESRSAIPQPVQDLNAVVGGPIKRFEAGANLAKWASTHVKERLVPIEAIDYSTESIASIRNQMPHAIAQDLEEYAQRRRSRGIDGGGSRLTVLFDGFEQLFAGDTEGWNDDWREDWRQDWFVRQFCQSTNLVLPIIFGREANRAVESWKTHYGFQGPIRSYEATLLAEQDCIEYFSERGITDPALMHELYKMTNGFAGHMALAADICVRFRQRTRRDPTVLDFETEEHAAPLWGRLLEKLLRQLSDEEKDVIKLAAIPRYFTIDILSTLVTGLERTSRLFSALTAYSFTASSTQDSRAFRVIEEPRALLKQRARSEPQWTMWNSRLRDYHWQLSDRIEHFAEGLYHQFIVNEEAALELFQQRFYKAVYHRRLHDAEMILQTYPQDEELSSATVESVRLARAFLLQTFWRIERELETAAKEIEDILSKELPPAIRAAALYTAAVTKERSGDRPGALRLARQSLSLYEELNDPAMLSSTHHLVGNLLFASGDAPQATEAHEQADRVLESVASDSDSILGKVAGGVLSGVDIRSVKRDGLRSTAGLYARIGRSLEAEMRFRELLSDAYSTHDFRAIAEAQSELAMVVRRLGRLGEAQALYRDAYARFEEVGDWVAAANVLSGLGLTAEMAGDDLLARSWFTQSINLFNQLGDKHGQAKLSQSLGRVAMRAGELDEAGSRFEFALGTYTAIGKHSFAGSVKLDLAELRLRAGPRDALPLVLELRDLVIRLDDKPAIAATNANLGTIYSVLGNRPKAREYWAMAATEYESLIASRPPYFAEEPIDESMMGRAGTEPIWLSHMYFHVPEIQDEMLRRLLAKSDLN